MRLRNKLIPILSLISVVGVSAPTISNCSYFYMYDITQTFIPTIEKAKRPNKALTDLEAQDLYFEDLQKNPDILVEDVLKYQSDKIASRIKLIEYPNEENKQEYIVTKLNATLGIQNVSAKKIETKTTTFYALCADVKYNFKYSAISVDSDHSYDYDFTYKMTLKNIPTKLFSANVFNPNQTNTSRAWYLKNIMTDENLLNASEGWKYTYEKNLKKTITKVDDKGNKTVETKVSNDADTIDTIEKLKIVFSYDAPTSLVYSDKYLYFKSYHMGNVESALQPSEQLLSFDIVDGQKSTINGSFGVNKKKVMTTTVNLCKIDEKLKEQFNQANSSRIYVGKIAPTTENEYIHEELPAGLQTHQVGYAYEMPYKDNFYYINGENKTFVDSLQIFSHGNLVTNDNFSILQTQTNKYYVRTNDWVVYSKNAPINDSIVWGCEKKEDLKFLLLDSGQSIGWAWKSNNEFKSDTYVLEEPIYIKLSWNVQGD